MLPRLYPILDVATVERRGGGNAYAAIARTLLHECGLLQLRAKGTTPQEIVRLCGRLTKLNGGNATLILNDRPDLALLAGFDGCHLGQDDLSIAGARKVLPRPEILGLSTHNQAQVLAGDATDADYLAVGPVFATASKQNPDPEVGLEEFARLRKLTSKPVVAIGGITRDNARQVLDAGADSVAMIGGLYRGCTAENFAEQFEQNVRDILARIL